MSGIMMAVLGGASGSPSLATYSLTTGNTGTVPNRYRGFDTNAFSGTAIGSITPSTFTYNGGTTLQALLYDEGVPQYVFQVLGGTNTGWSSLTVDGATTLVRSVATYSLVAGKSVWTWSTSDTISTQAFGASGSTHTITFT